MDFLNKLTQNQGRPEQSTGNAQSNEQGGFMGKVNGMLGGGKQGEQNEDLLDKGVDYVQEHFLGQGDQSNESAIEQMKDEQISDAIRGGWKNMTGKDFPVADKS